MVSAAVRKLEHELGIPKDFFDLSQIKFITRWDVRVRLGVYT